MNTDALLELTRFYSLMLRRETGWYWANDLRAVTGDRWALLWVDRYGN